MAETAEFKAPSWLNDQDAETIHQRMMTRLPADLDDTEGGIPWDLTKPTALEKAELLQFHLMETLHIMFPMWSYGEWLDYHAKGVGLVRKPANPAGGRLLITGIRGTEIPTGYLFAAPAVGDRPAIEYQTTVGAVIGADQTAEIYVTAVDAGVAGNVPTGTITIMPTPLQGVKSVVNPAPLTGGAAEESDEELRRRIDEVDAAATMSFVGNDADYIRWAEETPGVGTAMVMPEWAGPGTVKVVVVDANGQPANDAIVEAVHRHIVSPDDRLQRLAPIGATVSVTAPAGVELNFIFQLELKANETLEAVLDRFRAALQDYYVQAKAEGEVKYNQVSIILFQLPGVIDHAGLQINGGVVNIPLLEDEYPVTGTIQAQLVEEAMI